MQKVIFNEIDDIHSIETTIHIRLSLNFTQFWTSDCFHITTYVVYKTCKYKDNQMSHFGLIEEIMGQYH